MHVFLLSLIFFGRVSLGNLFFPFSLSFMTICFLLFLRIAHDKTLSTSRDFSHPSFYSDVDFSEL